MLRHQTLMMLALLLAQSLPASDFSGAKALEWTAKAVGFGPRQPASPAIAKLQSMIRAELKVNGWQLSEDTFTANTPVGPVVMRNIIARLAGKSGRSIVFTGHYDTKAMPFTKFVGANDGGSSTGWLLEAARVLPKQPRRDEVVLVFFDGEEAYGAWSDTNGIYGSRHLAEAWNKDGTLTRIKAFINVDMIGDRDLQVIDELNSSTQLRGMVRKAAVDLGYSKQFSGSGQPLEDDHMPFVRKGVNAIDIIDFDYGPNHTWWHTPEDTMDKLSGKSLQAVGDVLMEVFKRLQ
jgi:Zn-dependent M28 family amino/carboxypeptidase